MKHIKQNDQALLFELLAGAAIAVVVFFAISNVGTFINSTLGDELTDNYPTNTKSGNESISYSDLGTASGSHKINLSEDPDNINTDASLIYIYAYGNAFEYNLTVNNQQVNRSDNLSEGTGFNVTYAYLLANSSINNTDRVITFDYNVGDGTGNFTMIAVGEYYVSGDFRSTLQNTSYKGAVSLSDGYDDTISALVIAAIVMAITLPLAAVVAIRRFL